LTGADVNSRELPETGGRVGVAERRLDGGGGSRFRSPGGRRNHPLWRSRRRSGRLASECLWTSSVYVDGQLRCLAMNDEVEPRGRLARPAPSCGDLTGCTNVHTLEIIVAVEWDPAKAAANLKKHGVQFRRRRLVLEDPRGLTVDDPHPAEERHLTVGMDALGRVLVVSWTWRNENIRLISARKATKGPTSPIRGVEMRKEPDFSSGKARTCNSSSSRQSTDHHSS